jgi:hypothetical protein
MSDEIYSISIAYLASSYMVALLVIGARRKAIVTRGYYVRRLFSSASIALASASYTAYQIAHSVRTNVSALVAILVLISIIEAVGYLILKRVPNPGNGNDQRANRESKEGTWLT